MIFNTDKCKAVHFGYNNTAADYSLGDVNIQSVKEEKDLGIMIHQTLKSSQQCVAAANSANRTLGMINRTFVNKHSNIMLRLYQSLIRPKLEYCYEHAISFRVISDDVGCVIAVGGIGGRGAWLLSFSAWRGQ